MDKEDLGFVGFMCLVLGVLCFWPLIAIGAVFILISVFLPNR